jgi:hypothetical protein
LLYGELYKEAFKHAYLYLQEPFAEGDVKLNGFDFNIGI